MLERSLKPTDYLLLTALCLAMAVTSFVDGRLLTTHEATHCLNVREMFDSGNFAYATYGGRPWLERPPVPHWMTGVFAASVADCSTTWAMRVGSAVFGAIGVLFLAWAVAGATGRLTGLLAGAALATMREWATYSTGPEADIFIATFVTIAGCFFLRSEFGPRVNSSECVGFFGTRRWSVLAVFVTIGLTNNMKGPLFGTAFLTTSMAAYILLGRHWVALRRYVWLWGWLAYFAVGCLWPVGSLYLHPDVAEIWQADYGRRFNQNYLREPPHYYLVHVPWNLFPWTIPAIFGLASTARTVFRERNAFWQFIWAWAIVPPVVFSVFQGKHHHYMLNCIAPWAVLSAAGAHSMWLSIGRWKSWARNPLFGVVIVGLPLSVAVLAFQKKIPGPEWVAYVLAIGWPIVVGLAWWFVTRPNPKVAAGGFIALIVVVHIAAYLHRTAYLDRYGYDRAFLNRALELAPSDRTIYVLNEPDPLNAAWLLYYLGQRSTILHNETFLNSADLPSDEVFVVARGRDASRLTPYGTVTTIDSSDRTRGEKVPEDRYTLFRLRYRPDLIRHPAPRISAMQATGRGEGPYLPKP